MSESAINSPKLPLSVKLAAFYLLWCGISGVMWPLLGLGSHHAEFEAKSAAFKAGSYVRSISFALAFLIAGVGILSRKSWARKLALVLLVLDIPYSATEFAWGFARGRPSLSVLLVSYGMLAAWSGLWFYLLMRRRAADATKAQPSDGANAALGAPRSSS